MNKSLIAASLILTTASAFAMDDMKKDGMAKDGAMNKGSMTMQQCMHHMDVADKDGRQKDDGQTK